MRPFLALAPLFALLVGLGTFTGAYTRPVPASAQTKPNQIKLAVLVVFDQMRGDYPARWRELYGTGGFLRLMTEGAWFTNCHYPYGTTTTGPGHASILTGTCPDHHGIINNNWNEKGVDVYCAGDTRYQIVPAIPAEMKAGKPVKPPAGGTPERLLSETVADVLKQSHPRSKVFGLSLKDRSAILPTGKKPDGAFWFDGRFVTSTYYTDKLDRSYPDWMNVFRMPNRADNWFGKDWVRSRPDIDYSRYSGPDAAAGEGAGTKQGALFPHPTTGGLRAPGKEYYDALANSPFGNDLLLEAVRQCVISEKLGLDDVPDLLVVSFSSNDLIGHTWGPDSQEMLDVTLQSDGQIASLLHFLDSRVGKGSYALALTADHGICPLPEQARVHGRTAKRITRTSIQDRAEKYLRDRFSDVQVKEKTAWVEAFSFPWIYLNPRLIAASGRSPEVVANALARYLRTQADLGTAFSREELSPSYPAIDEIHQRMKRSYHPARSGDVCVVLKPFDLPSEKKEDAAGTTHGSPYDYDSFVPLMVMGPGITGGPRPEPVTPQAAAAIFARWLGVHPPADAEYIVPTTLYR